MAMALKILIQTISLNTAELQNKTNTFMNEEAEKFLNNYNLYNLEVTFQELNLLVTADDFWNIV